jgi:hypothetical protein
MPVAKVYVALGPHGNIERIFRNNHDAYNHPGTTALVHKGSAITAIRDQIVERCCNRCELCGIFINSQIGEMHEKHPRGELRNGKYGEYSLDNSIFICRSCHTTGPNAAHSDRRWHSAKLG